MSVIQANVTSFRKNFLAIQTLIQCYHPRFLALQEINSATCTPGDLDYAFPDYWLGSCSIREGRPGGGVAILVHKSIDASCVKEVDCCDAGSTSVECCAIEVDAMGQNFQLSSVYVPPDAPSLDVRPIHRDFFGEFVLCGDFNAVHDAWSGCNKSNKGHPLRKIRGDQLCHQVSEMGLAPINCDDFTTANRSVLDVAFASPGFFEAGQSSHCVIPLLLSGVHYPALFEIPVEKVRPDKRKINNYKKVDGEAFLEALEDYYAAVGVDATFVNGLCSASDAAFIITDSILMASKKEVPRATARSRFLGKGADFLKDWFIYGCPESKALMRAKNEDFRGKCSSLNLRLDPREAYRHMTFEGEKKRPRGAKTKEAPEDLVKRLVTDFSRSDADFEVSDFLRSIVDKGLDSTLAGSGNTPRPFTSADVLRQLELVDGTKAGGCDGIDSQQLVLARESTVFVDLVTKLANIMLFTGEIPAAFRRAVVAPVPKPDGVSWRPISLLCCIDKVCQGLFVDRITDSTASDISGVQYAFREHMGCDLATLHLKEVIESSRDSVPQVAALLVDWKQAFDRVPRERLIQMLIEDYDLDPHIIRYVRNYLRDRKMEVRLRTYTACYASGWAASGIGVVQGSRIGPALFTLFCNSLLLSLSKKHHCIAFADDLSIVVVAQSPRELTAALQSALDEVEDWSIRNHLPINENKTKIMDFSRNKPPVPPHVCFNAGNGRVVEVVREQKVLGVTFDDRLSFNSHVNNVISAVNARKKGLMALCGQTWGPTCDTVRTLHLSMVHCCVSYGITCWFNNCAKGLLAKLQIALNECLRCITGLPAKCPSVTLHHIADVPTVGETYFSFAMTLLDKICRLPQMEIHNLLINNGRIMEPECSLRGLWDLYQHALPPAVFRRDPFVVASQVFDGLAQCSYRISVDTLENDEQVNAILGNASVVLATDGSVVKGDNLSGDHADNAGFGFVVRRVSDGAVDYNSGFNAHGPGGALSSSYDAEILALTEGIKCAKRTQSTAGCRCGVIILTDSLSALMKIRSRNAATQAEKELFEEIVDASRVFDMSFYHVRAHAGVELNELADAEADRGLEQQRNCAQCVQTSVSHRAVKTFWHAFLKNNRKMVLEQLANKPQSSVGHYWLASSGGAYVSLRGSDLPRAVQLIINQLQAGFCPQFCSKAIAMDDFKAGAQCPWCVCDSHSGGVSFDAAHILFSCAFFGSGRAHLSPPAVTNRNLAAIFKDRNAMCDFAVTCRSLMHA